MAPPPKVALNVRVACGRCDEECDVDACSVGELTEILDTARRIECDFCLRRGDPEVVSVQLVHLSK